MNFAAKLWQRDDSDASLPARVNKTKKRGVNLQERCNVVALNIRLNGSAQDGGVLTCYMDNTSNITFQKQKTIYVLFSLCLFLFSLFFVVATFCQLGSCFYRTWCHCDLGLVVLVLQTKKEWCQWEYYVLFNTAKGKGGLSADEWHALGLGKYVCACAFLYCLRPPFCVLILKVMKWTLWFCLDVIVLLTCECLLRWAVLIW